MVSGTYEYHVTLWKTGSQLDYSCSCPLGDEEVFCKHCVAVGLAWLAGSGIGNTPKRKTQSSTITMDEVRAFLERQEKSTLVHLLMDRAMEDDRLRERLLMKTARATPQGVDLATFRRAIDHAVHPRGFVEYASMWEYTRGIEEVVESIKELLSEGYASEAIELTEYGLAVVEKQMGSVDDSDGGMGDILHELQELHHTACKQAKPDPETLAKRLFEWELRSEYEVFYGAAATYADVLGEHGLSIYRKLTEAEWARMPSLGPGREDPDRYGKRFRTTAIMETLAQRANDLEALVAVKNRDLSHAYAYLTIAALYKKAHQEDQALAWAERGLKAFPHRTDTRLREFLAEEYHRRDRHDEAMALIWAEFTETPSLDTYRLLKRHAKKASTWAEWRTKALTLLREKVANTKATGQKKQWNWALPSANSELVRIFLWEKADDAAWREAKANGCTTELWMQLAARREKQHPEDALPIYRNRIEPIINQKHNQAYEDGVRLLRKMGELMARLGQQEEFARYIEMARIVHKPKRNFMKLLDEARLGVRT